MQLLKLYDFQSNQYIESIHTSADSQPGANKKGYPQVGKMLIKSPFNLEA